MPGPAPDAAAASVPTIHAQGGGGSGGGGGGKKGKKGKGKKRAGKGKGKQKAGKGGKGAPKSKGKKTGDPVDVASGAVTASRTDIDLPGIFPFDWTLTYDSRSALADDARLGFGWTHPYAVRLEVLSDEVVFIDDDGLQESFPLLDPGERMRGAYDRTLIRDPRSGYSVKNEDNELVWEFRPSAASAQRLILARIRDTYGNHIAVHYDEAERITHFVDTIGRTIRLVHGYDGRIAAVEVKNAVSQGDWVALVQYRYSAEGDLVEVTDAEGFPRRYSYDEHMLVAATNRNGLTFYYRYDSLMPTGRCIETWGAYEAGPDPAVSPSVPTDMDTALGKMKVKGIFYRLITYDDDVTEAWDSRGGAVRFETNEQGEVEKEVDEVGGVATIKYNDFGQPLEYIDEDESVWRWVRDAKGRVTEWIDPLQRSMRFRYGEHALPVEVTAPNGTAWTLARDAHGRLVHAKDPYGNTEQYVYDERGFIVELQRSGKPPIRVRRNELMQVISVTEGPRETQFVHDYWGRLLSVRAADGTSVRFQYNRRGDLILQVDPRGHVTRFEYDPEGNLVGVLAPDGSVRRARYGGENWITEVTDARGLTTKVLYDNEGEVVECINERGERFVFDYDLGGRVTATHTFDGRTIRYAYTRGGLLKRTIEADGSTILFEHDAVGNLIEMSAPSGSERYEYDSLDFIIAAQNDWSKVTFKRDLCGRVTNEILEFAGARYEVESRYDANGARIGWRAGQREVAFDFDSAGQLLARVFDGSRRQELQHDVMGRLTGWSYPTGVRAQLGYEAGGMLSGLRVLKPKGVRGIDVGLTEAAGEQAVLWRSFEYSVTNELVRVLDMTAGETRFAYDAFGQLLQRATARTQEVFSYDVTRNVSPAGAPAVVGPGNRLLALGTTELTWDAAGRLATKKQRVAGAERVWQYRWQATGFLEEVTDPDGVVWAFEYDPFGRRTRKWSSQGDEVHFAWDGNALAMERRQRADGSVDERTYLFEEDDATFPVAQHANGKWFDYVTSPIGTPTELVDDTGEIGWAATLKAFGEVEDERAVQTDTPLRFPGQYADRETGLHYNRFRYYDPELGRFISPDPTSIEGNIHEWAYARNPIGWVDPLGFEDGAALAKGMGSNPPPGFAAHHVIPESLFKDPKIQGLLGKDPHTKQNGIHLPGSQEAHDAHKASKKPPKPPAKTIHKGGHAGYTKAVKKKLLAIAKDKNLSPSQKQKKAKELQKQIQKELQDGTFEFQNTSGKTVSGVNKNGTVG